MENKFEIGKAYRFTQIERWHEDFIYRVTSISENGYYMEILKNFTGDKQSSYFMIDSHIYAHSVPSAIVDTPLWKAIYRRENE